MSKEILKVTIVVAIIAVSALGGYILFSREEAEKWVEYSNDKFHYRIEYPSDWSREVLYGGTMVSLRSGGSRNRTLLISVARQYDKPLDDFVEEKIMPMLTDPKYTNATSSVENTTLGGNEGRLVDIHNASFTVEGKEFICRQKCVVTFTRVNGIKHPVMLLLTALESDDEAWDEVFPYIVESFEFI